MAGVAAGPMTVLEKLAGVPRADRRANPHLCNLLLLEHFRHGHCQAESCTKAVLIPDEAFLVFDALGEGPLGRSAQFGDLKSLIRVGIEPWSIETGNEHILPGCL